MREEIAESYWLPESRFNTAAISSVPLPVMEEHLTPEAEVDGCLDDRFRHSGLRDAPRRPIRLGCICSHRVSVTRTKAAPIWWVRIEALEIHGLVAADRVEPHGSWNTIL